MVSENRSGDTKKTGDLEFRKWSFHRINLGKEGCKQKERNGLWTVQELLLYMGRRECFLRTKGECGVEDTRPYPLERLPSHYEDLVKRKEEGVCRSS